MKKISITLSARKYKLNIRFRTGGLMDKKGIEYDEIKTG